jgi:hypothetical protein
LVGALILGGTLFLGLSAPERIRDTLLALLSAGAADPAHLIPSTG